MGLLNDCPSCYEQRISQCVTELIFALGLTAGETYFFTFTDNHNKEHVVGIEADESGRAVIDVLTLLPSGFFIVYSGSKTVTWKQNGCDDLCFTPCDEEGAEEYCCIILTPVDRTSDEDEISETIPCCAETPVLPETLVFATILFNCIKPNNGTGTISGTFTATNGSGNYGLQVFIGTWQTVEFPVTSPFSFNIANPSAGAFQTRIIDIETDVFSNELQLTTTTCKTVSPETLVLKSVQGFSCASDTGILTAVIDAKVISPIAAIVLEYYNGATWQIIASSIISGNNSRDLPVEVFNGTWLMRLRDTTTNVTSLNLSVTTPNCLLTEIVLTSLQFRGAPFTLAHGYTTTNAFEYSGGLLDLLREYSTDNITFLPISNVGGWLAANPDNASHNNQASDGLNYVSGNYARVTGRDINGALINSNSLRMVDDPTLTKADPYCFAGQAGLTIHGFTDVNFNQDYILEFTPTGSGDPYTQAATLVATAGEFGDFNFPVGAFNQYSGVSLDFRVRSAVYAWIFSGDVTVIMLPPC